MAYERKNKKLKEFALGSTCHINMPYSIAIRHQLQQCYIKEFCAPMEHDISLGPIICNNAYNCFKKLLPNNMPINLSVVTLKYVQILGKKFDVGTFLVTRFTNKGPQFGKIKEIFYCKNIYFHISEFHTIYFNNYYHAYKVISNTDKPEVLLNVQLVPKLSPCLYVVIEDNEFIATRYNI